MKRTPSPQGYAALLTERDDLRAQLRAAHVVVAEARALAERYKAELKTTMRTKAELAAELEDTRRVVARQEEELRSERRVIADLQHVVNRGTP